MDDEKAKFSKFMDTTVRVRRNATGRYLASVKWSVDWFSVLGEYETPVAALDAAKSMVQMRDIPRIATPADIDAVRRELAKAVIR